jgi:hypothetical protein
VPDYGRMFLELKYHRYNPKHLYLKLNGYGDSGQKKVWSSCSSKYCTCFGGMLHVHCAYPSLSLHAGLSTFTLRLHYQQMSQLVTCKELQKCLLFSHVEYCDMHFVYGFCYDNARAAVDEYQRRFTNRRIPSSGVFSHVHHAMRETVCLTSVVVQSEREVVPMINP